MTWPVAEFAHVWPSHVRLDSLATVLSHGSAMLCWLQVMAHPLFRRAIKGHWCLAEVRRVSVAEHLVEMAQSVDERGERASALVAYTNSFKGATSVWWFRIENDVFNGKPGGGLAQAIKGEIYDFVFDAAAMRLLWAHQSEWRGF